MEEKKEEPKKVANKRSFSEEFKAETVRLADKIGNSKAAKELGINESSIRSWRKKLNPTPEDLIAFKNKKSYQEIEKENKKIKKEIEYLKEINMVLKKSLGILSLDQIKDLK